jgi:uncharacterized membrane protein YhaH (DUF805 family)
MKWYLKVLKHYADFSGRASRKEYWMFALFNFLALLLFAGIDIVAWNITGDDTSTLFLFTASYLFAVQIPSLAVSIRRLHDVGKSGWWYLIGLIPIIGVIWLLILFVQKGDTETNKYGELSSLYENYTDRRKQGSAAFALMIYAIVAIISQVRYQFLIYELWGELSYIQMAYSITDVIAFTAGIMLLPKMVDKCTIKPFAFLLFIFTLLHLIASIYGYIQGFSNINKDTSNTYVLTTVINICAEIVYIPLFILSIALLAKWETRKIAIFLTVFAILNIFLYYVLQFINMQSIYVTISTLKEIFHDHYYFIRPISLLVFSVFWLSRSK